jgi:hypothetical protein
VKLVLSTAMNMKARKVLYGYNTGNNDDDNNSNKKARKITEKTKCNSFFPFQVDYLMMLSVCRLYNVR